MTVARRISVFAVTSVFILSNMSPAFANRPVPTPHPVPAPSAPSATPPVTPPDTTGARHAGYSDGQADGSREGNVRGPVEGDHEGRERGFREGFDRCEREERQRAYDAGYREGFTRGEYEGNIAGQSQGEQNGRGEGDREGRADGLRRADRDSNAEAAPLGRAKGIDEANRSDASDRGQRDGVVSGDRDAHAKADSEDYARGRKDLRDGRFAEPIDSQDEFSQRSSRVASAGLGTGALKSMLRRTGLGADAPLMNTALNYSATPDRRFYNPRPRYSNPEEIRAYEGGYRDGYDSGFQSNYRYAYDRSYDRARDAGRNDGCRSARGRSYDIDFRRGHSEGHSAGYSRAYNNAYAQAYRYAYDQAFSYASQNAYRDSYRGYYDRHFEEARSEAYAERVGELYQAAFDRAYRQKFDQVYPGYAAEAYRRGQVDETRDFELRPVRLLSAQATETILNGLYEPGEALRIRIQLRNFAASGISGKDVKVQLQALDPRSATIGIAEAVLSKGLNAKSLTRVSELLEFRIEESAVNKATSFRVTAFYQGRNVGEQLIEIVPRFLLGMEIEGAPELREGMPGKLAVRVKNQSQVPSDAGTVIRLSSNPAVLEVIEGAVTIGILNPGESQVLEFRVIARKGGTPDVPLMIEAVGGGSRRIGLFDQTREIPVLNDYTIRLTQSLDSLRKQGIVRVEYVIRNISSREVMRGLQLHITVTPKAGEPFSVLGPNPQYLSPLRRGQEASFVVPILSKAVNEGGVLQVEVKEDGNTVVVHRSEF